MKHTKFDEVFPLVQADISVLAYGDKGVGKTTLMKQVAEALAIPFYTVSCTQQTTLSNFVGFMNVNGIYVPSMLRKAVEHGGLFLLDEIDAANPNVLVGLNTLENGFLAFPDKVVECHENFRLVATANPFNGHADYTGRAVLDAATLDRFDKVEIPHDNNLEATLVSPITFREVRLLREVITAKNVHLQVSMRDALRYEKRKVIGLATNYIQDSLLKEYPDVYTYYKDRCKAAAAETSEVEAAPATEEEERWDGNWKAYNDPVPGGDWVPTQDTANTLGEIWTIISKGETK